MRSKGVIVRWGKTGTRASMKFAAQRFELFPTPDLRCDISLDTCSFPPIRCMAEVSTMSVRVRAIYENGVFRPLQAVDLPERQEVTVTVEDQGEEAKQVLFVLPPDRWQAFCDVLDAPAARFPLRKLLTEASVLDGNDASLPRPGPA